VPSQVDHSFEKQLKCCEVRKVVVVVDGDDDDDDDDIKAGSARLCSRSQWNACVHLRIQTSKKILFAFS
jgi:hypothetical protein